MNPYLNQTHRMDCGCSLPACVRLREMAEHIANMEAVADLNRKIAAKLRPSWR